MASAGYMPYSPSRSTAIHSSHIPGGALSAPVAALPEKEKYLLELLAERQKMSPFLPVLPHCYRLLNQEILRVTALVGNESLLDQTGLEHGSSNGGLFSNGGVTDITGWGSVFQSERSRFMQHSPSHAWLGPQNNSSGLVVKRTIRIDVPVDKYPTFNFVGRLLGPRGNSLKRVEALTDCRVLIRGQGSIKDPAREEMMRGKAGYEHLSEPLHVLVEAELPIDLIDARLMQAHEILEDLLKPMDESEDFFKKQQLRELAVINSTLREGHLMSGSVSPFHNNLGMKRAKTRG